MLWTLWFCRGPAAPGDQGVLSAPSSAGPWVQQAALCCEENTILTKAHLGME